MTLNEIFQDMISASSFTFFGRTHGAAWADFNGDSFPDIFVSNHDSTFGGGLVPGTLPTEQFNLGTKVADSDDRFIYNQSNGSFSLM